MIPPSAAQADPPLQVLHYLDAIREEAGGVVRSVLDLCGQLAASGQAISLATYDPSDVPSQWLQGQANTPIVIDLTQPGHQLSQLVQSSDVVHLHTPWDRRNVRWGGLCRRWGVPYLLTAHGMLDDWSMAQKGFKKRLYWRLWGRRLLEGAYRVHCTAEGEARQAAPWYPRGKSIVLPLIVDLPDSSTLPPTTIAIEQFPPLQTEQPRVLFLSRLHPKKGVETLLQATRQAFDAGTEFQLFLAGPGQPRYVAELQQRTDRLGLTESVHFLGMVQGEVKLSLYQACDLFVLPTHQENFGLVLAEALTCGTPVLTTRGVDIWPEIAEAGGVIADHDAASLAQQIGQLLSDRPALAERGRIGQAFLHNWLNPAHVLQGYRQLYQSAVSAQQPG